MMQWMKTEAAIFAFALQFLTRIPIPSGITFTQQRFEAGIRYYPLVGCIVGSIAAAVYALSASALPSAVAVLLSTAATLLVTGAFHEDGLADTFDGVGGGTDRQRTLEIMKDSRIGTYGACALGIILLLKLASLSALAAPQVIVASLVAGHCLSRISSVAVIATSHYARDHGTGKPVASNVTFSTVVVTSASGFLCCWAMLNWIEPLALFTGLGGAIAGHIAMRLLFEKRLSGYTGDTLGAVQQVSEVGFYLGVLACQ